MVSAFARFVREGLGTPAPVAAPTRLVVGGVYRYVRNPMYLAVTAIIVGEALLLYQPVLLLVAALALAAMVVAPKVELAVKRVAAVKTNVEVGLAQRVDLAEATLELRTLETELAKAQLDLALIRRRLQEPVETRPR